MLERVRIRITQEEASDDVINEFIKTVSDRLCLRLGVEILPNVFESICVDAVVKMVRRVYYEGMSSESVTNLSNSFVDDILKEYAEEVAAYKDNQSNSGEQKRVLRFL